MPTLHPVTVTYDSNLELQIEPASLAIGDDDWVLWQFRNVPSGYVPHVYFPTPFGPFQLVDMIGSDKILARGKIDLPGTTGSYTYPYKAMLLNAEGVGAIGEAQITNTPQPGNTSPNALIRCTEVGPGTWSITVTPQNLYLYLRDAATWHILGVPEDHFVTLAFYETADPRRGPFATFFQGRADDPSLADVFQAIGTDFAWNQPQLGYRAELRNADGQIVATDDPVIDNIGTPPT